MLDRLLPVAEAGNTAELPKQVSGPIVEKNSPEVPDRGDVMQGSGGLMKVRMRLPGRGKSGGARVIYLYLKQHDVIILFYLDTKAKSETLTAAQLKSLKMAVTVIKQQFRP